MTRDIEFRAWDDTDRKFYYFPIGQGSANFNAGGIYDRLCLNGAKFEQYTGLEDKNGRKIFEGDLIVRIEEDCAHCEDGCICNSDDCPQIETVRDEVTLEHFRYWLTNETFGYEGEDLINPAYCEVIGNIHENPELIP